MVIRSFSFTQVYLMSTGVVHHSRLGVELRKMTNKACTALAALLDNCVDQTAAVPAAQRGLVLIL